MDILRATLASGIKVVDYVPTYENLPNDYEHVTQCKISSSFHSNETTHVLTVLKTSGIGSTHIMYVHYLIDRVQGSF